MGQASDFGHTLGHQLLIATEVVTDQATAPVTQKDLGILPGTTFAKGFCCIKDWRLRKGTLTLI
jgi:hypothetical protein